MTVISVIFTACRLFANRKKMWWSDYFVATALILSLGQTALMLAQTRFARHQWDVRACWYDGTYTKTWASVLLSGRPQKELIWGVVQSAVGTVLDLFIFILPIPIIMRLQLSTKKKVQLLAVFTTALVGVMASVLSLVYRVEALDTDDGTWKYTSLLICSVVETDVAIIVSCTPGVANFTRVYVSELRIIKSLRSNLGGSSSGKSSMNQKEDPNRPRTKNGFGKQENHQFDVLSDSFILKSTSSTERGEAGHSIPLTPTSNSPGILRTVDISQKAHLTPTHAIQEPQIQNYPTGSFYYGPNTIQPPTQPIWFYYVPLSNQQLGGPYHDPGTYTPEHYPGQISTERLV
ncbi:hypothetical protein F4776DRAFT_658568 [Hypoxylon sp. NC0597]|nr:hypothetical protein F4776DRAFT_658568 [Hypoxylon sp. NC0597]